MPSENENNRLVSTRGKYKPRRYIINPDPLHPARPPHTAHQPFRAEFRRAVLEGAGLVQDPGDTALEDETAVSVWRFGLDAEVVEGEFHGVDDADEVNV
jgi:hypothetical protein